MEIKSIYGPRISTAIELIWNTFLQFEAPDYSDEGIKSFKDFIGSKEIISTLESIDRSVLNPCEIIVVNDGSQDNSQTIIDEYEKKYKAKPWICRITDKFKTYAFENNLPSHFMKVFTGIEPRVIAEKDFNLDLNDYRAEVMELFKRMDKEKEYSFVIGTGAKMLDGRTWHVYVLEDVDLENNTITVKEKRGNQPRTMNIDTALNTFKYIAGYFNSDLEQKN